MSNHESFKIKKHESPFKNDKQANKYLRLADAFLEYEPNILYWTERDSTKKGCFYHYDKGVYFPVTTLHVENMLIDFTPDDRDIVTPRNISQAKIQETMIYIMRRRFFYGDKFDPEGIINFKNGFYNIETHEIYPHSPDIISTSQLPYEMDETATCENFLKAITDACEGDLTKIAVIQEFAGYCLIKSCKYHKALFLIGAAGSGKSTILDGITAMLGEYNVSSVSMENLGNPRFTGNFITKLANIDREIPKNIENYEEPLKKIVVGEPVTVDTKFIQTYDAKPRCKIIFAANDFPKVADTSDGLFRRMLLINFNNVVENIDVNLIDKVKEEGAGIFNWALIGLKRLKENEKFSPCLEIVENINELKTINNTVYYFINEKYDFDSESYVVFDDLYEKYKSFSHSVGGKGIFKKLTFSKELKKTFGKKIEVKNKSINSISRSCVFGLKEKIQSLQPSNEIAWNE